MIDINATKDEILYTDYEKCLDLLRNIKMDDYKYPDHPTIFHTYTEVRNEKELMVIKSYLATQDLEKTKLWVWSDWDISDNPLIQPYKNLVEFKVYNPIEEANGTILSEKNPFLNTPYPDKLKWVRSDILRLLLGNKYGGIWVDMDIIFLRNFKPILDQEYAYVWGSDYKFKDFGPCGTVLSIFKGSELSTLFLEEVLSVDLESTLRNYASAPIFSHFLFRSAYFKKPYTVFPSSFFNTEWQINMKHNGLGTAIEDGWFTPNEYSTTIFPEAFSWHWHNNRYKTYKVSPNSKFDILTNLINNALVKKGIING